MRNTPDLPLRAATGRAPARPGRVLLVWVLVAALLGGGSTACTTAQMRTPPSVDALEQVPVGARVRIVTRAGTALDLRVTAATNETLTGRDRYFRSHDLPRDEIASIEAPPQQDWWVALFFFAIVFVART
jgi:hypothetical protein